jgi:hypothetical protein
MNPRSYNEWDMYYSLDAFKPIGKKMSLHGPALAPIAIGVGLALAAASTGMAVASSMSAAKQQKRQARVQALQVDVQGERQALQYEQEANAKLRQLQQINGAAAARGFAGGVSGFQGSAGLTQSISEKMAGQDIASLQAAATTSRTFGEIQGAMLIDAGNLAAMGHYADAASSMMAFGSNLASGAPTLKSSPKVQTTGGSGANINELGWTSK